MSVSDLSVSEFEPEAAAPAKNQLIPGLLLFAFVFCFWFTFSTFVETFYRDDNVGGVVPILTDLAKTLLHGRMPVHTDYVGGGGGFQCLLSMSGLLNPFVTLPALLMANHPELLCNFIVSLHFALFAAGGYFLGLVLRARRWVGIVAGLSLAFSGYFVFWSGNWMNFVTAYAFLPWIIAGIFGIFNAQSFRQLFVYESISSVAIFLLFLTGGPFAPFHGGIATLIVIASMIADKPSEWKKFLLRLCPLGVLFLAVVVPLLLDQKEAFESLGGREPNSVDWRYLSVPLRAYLGLLIPPTESVWAFPWFTVPIVTSNAILMCGVVPAWYILATLFRKPTIFLRPRVIVLLVGVALFLVIMSPDAFDLSFFFAQTPVLNVFRWPFRAITAFHMLLIVLFVSLATELDSELHRFWKWAAVVTCVGASVISLRYEVSLMQGYGTQA